MKQTKKQLIEELITVKHDYENLLLKDQLNRKEFAKAFCWHKQPKPYSGAYNEPPEPILPSWEQIWVNLGTLLTAQNFMEFEGDISELKIRLQNFEEKITKEFSQLSKNPN